MSHAKSKSKPGNSFLKQPGYLPICHARMLGICTCLVFMLRLFLRMKTSRMCVRLALLHSTVFLYRSQSSSRSVVETVSSNIDKALVLQPSVNTMVCGGFNAHVSILL